MASAWGVVVSTIIISVWHNEIRCGMQINYTLKYPVLSVNVSVHIYNIRTAIRRTTNLCIAKFSYRYRHSLSTVKTSKKIVITIIYCYIKMFINIINLLHINHVYGN